VNEVKPLLVSAKRIGLEIDEGKRIINDAIQAGKGRDIERAVTLIADARRALDIAFVDFIGKGIERFVQEIRAAKGEAGVGVVTPGLLEAVGRMEAGDYDGAWDTYQIEAATRIGQQASERLKRDVPDFVQEEMRKARSQLLDLKLKGNDLAKPIGILKESSALVKREAWAEALRQIRDFYKEIQRLE